MENDEQFSSSAKQSFWPILILSISFSVYLAFQLTLVTRSTSLSKQQLVGLNQQIEKAQNSAIVSRNIQSVLERLANDLLVLANTDVEAKKLIDKYQIRRNTASPAS
jgi:hypothetical protein